jgi:hypothetical protein
MGSQAAGLIGRILIRAIEEKGLHLLLIESPVGQKQGAVGRRLNVTWTCDMEALGRSLVTFGQGSVLAVHVKDDEIGVLEGRGSLED